VVDAAVSVKDIGSTRIGLSSGYPGEDELSAICEEIITGDHAGIAACRVYLDEAR
jgi:hypothetical protein